MSSSEVDGSCGTPVKRRSSVLRPALVAPALSLTLLAGLVAPASAGPSGATPADAAARTVATRQMPPATTAAGQPGSTTRGTAAHRRTVAIAAVAAPATSPVGSILRNPATDRREVVVPDIRRTAVLIGDSQSVGPDSWPQTALRELGYSVSFAGAGGTGYVAANAQSGAPNYYDAFAGNAWALPQGDPALVVVEGGGNDATQGASDGDILASANALILGLRRTYPSSRFLLIGTLSRSAQDGGGRRNEVDALLGDFAKKRGIPFVSAGEWLTTHNLKAYLADQVHLSQEGNRRAAGVLEQYLSALRLGTDYTVVDPSTRWPRTNQPLE